MAEGVSYTWTHGRVYHHLGKEEEKKEIAHQNALYYIIQPPQQKLLKSK